MSYKFYEYMPLPGMSGVVLAPLGIDTYVAVYRSTESETLRLAVVDMAAKTVHASIMLDSGITGEYDICHLFGDEFAILWTKLTSVFSNDMVAKLVKIEVTGTTISIVGVPNTFFGGEFYRGIFEPRILAAAANSVTMIYSTSEFYTSDTGLHIRAAINGFDSLWAVQPVLNVYYWRDYNLNYYHCAERVGIGTSCLIAAPDSFSGASRTGALLLVQNTFTGASLLDVIELPHLMDVSTFSAHTFSRYSIRKTNYSDSTRFLVSWAERATDGSGASLIAAAFVEISGSTIELGEVIVVLDNTSLGGGQFRNVGLTLLESGRYRLLYADNVNLFSIILSDGGTVPVVDRVDFGRAETAFYLSPIPLPSGGFNEVGNTNGTEISGLYLFENKFHQIQEGEVSFWVGNEGDINQKSNLPAVTPSALAVNQAGEVVVGFGSDEIKVIRSGNYTTWEDISFNHPPGRVTHLEWTAKNA